MASKETQKLRVKFLKCLSKIKGWTYNDNIETEKRSEIKNFISCYIFNTIESSIHTENLSYTHLDNLCNHSSFKPVIKAILILLEVSRDEQEFIHRYTKATTGILE